MLVFSDVQSLCISARLWLQVGSPKRLRSDLNQTVSFPPTLFSSSTLKVHFKSILAHTCTASPLTSVMCSQRCGRQHWQTYVHDPPTQRDPKANDERKSYKRCIQHNRAYWWWSRNTERASICPSIYWLSTWVATISFLSGKLDNSFFF